MDRVLSLDISTKTGWALIVSGDESYSLEAWGHIKKTSEPKGQYPGNYVDWAYQCFGEIVKLIDEHQPTVLVIEETASGSKNLYSQKILEYTHFLVARLIRDTGITCMYLLTEEWRRLTGCQMTKDESKHNKKVKQYKEKSGKSIAYDENGKRVGKLTRKHINVRRANELFESYFSEPLKMKDEDTADALLLGYAFHGKKLVKGALPNGL
jgi:Holliday junction resolvasome RuvABC endonuclease subunit